jgi:DNA polymerase
LAEVGAWRYTTHATTQIWCCAYGTEDGPVQLWTPDDPIPPEFIEAARDPAWTVSAFNDSFERLVEQHIMGPRHGWPIIPIERHRCLQAAALALALPAKLDGVAKALDLKQQKDAAGHKLMLQMSKPRRARRDEDPNAILWFDDNERLARLYSYCKQDLLTEIELHKRIGALSADEQALWQLDAIINARGIYIDGKLLDAAINIATAAQHEINAELQTITDGNITSVNQTKALIAWLAERGCEVTDLQKHTLRKALTRKRLPSFARRVIELRLDGAHAAAAKLHTMRAWRNDDGRARYTFRYHGASTGRWTSHGIQLQNMKRPEVDDIAAAIAAVSSGNFQQLRQ